MALKFVTLRFNMEKKQHRHALEMLRQRHDNEGCSYPDVVLQALLHNVEEGIEKKHGEVSIDQSSVEKITTATEEMLRKTLLPLFTKMSAQSGMLPTEPPIAVSSPEQEANGESEYDIIPDDEIPWDYLGD